LRVQNSVFAGEGGAGGGTERRCFSSTLSSKAASSLAGMTTSGVGCVEAVIEAQKKRVAHPLRRHTRNLLVRTRTTSKFELPHSALLALFCVRRTDVRVRPEQGFFLLHCNIAACILRKSY
jgi:hypothetical protein